MIDQSTDYSLVLSAALAVIWTWWGDGFEESRADAGDTGVSETSFLGNFVRSTVMEFWGILVTVCSPQLVPGLLVLYAASSPRAVLDAALSFDIYEGYKPTGEAPPWMGPSPDRKQILALAAALAVWRAEKLDSLLKRMQKTVVKVRGQGTGQFVVLCVRDPWGFAKPEVWSVVRRGALAALATIGCVPFVRVAFPACVLDEGLKYVTMTALDVWERRVARYLTFLSVPMPVSILLLPVMEVLHCGLMAVKMLLLGILTYPLYERPGANPGLLVACTVFASIHNYQCLDGLIRQIPESAEQIWQVLRGG